MGMHPLLCVHMGHIYGDLLPASDSELALQVLEHIGLVQLQFTLEVLLQAINNKSQHLVLQSLPRSRG
jgi:hypothetical protein